MDKTELAAAWFCLHANLRKATRAAAQLYARALDPAGLPGTQFTTLVALFMLEQTTVGELAEALAMDQTTVTRGVKLLEKNGWVTSQAGDDRRTRLLRLTEDGEKVLEAAFPVWQAVQAQMVEKLGPEDADTLLELLGKVVDIGREAG